MMHYLIDYVKAEGRCDETRATEIAYGIVDILDEMIHDRLEDEEDDY